MYDYDNFSNAKNKQLTYIFFDKKKKMTVKKN